MPNLKIKIGDTITPAPELFIIKVPQYEIPADIFTVLSTENKAKASQLIICQESPNSLFDVEREEIVIPDDVCNREGIQNIWLRGKFRNIPSFIFKQKHLTSLGLSGEFESIPELLGEM